MNDAQALDGASLIESLAPLRFVRLRVRMEALESLRLPEFKGSTLRGGFGVALRQTACATGGHTCAGCEEARSCVYSYVFETPVPPQAQRMRKYTSAPHPFVLDAPATRRTDFGPGDSLEFGLVLVGRAIGLAPHVVMALKRMAAQGLGKGNGRLRLVEIHVEKLGNPRPSQDDVTADNGGQNPIVTGDQLPSCDRLPSFDIHDLMREASLATNSAPATSSARSAGAQQQECQLTFVTPCRLMRGGALTDRPDFHVVFRSILRNITSLAYFHCGLELNLPHQALALASEHVALVEDQTRWWDWERYSRRQKTRMSMGGITGSAVYSGNLRPFEPFLRLATVLHVGKGTSMGLGEVTVNATSETEAV